MSDPDDYEALPPSTGPAIHMTAGALAGVLEHCVMYPVDSVKTRLQSLAPATNGASRGITEVLMQMVRTEGLLRPMRGMSAMMAGAGPAHALYFSAYEKLKEAISVRSLLSANENHVAHGIAACLATVLHDAIMTPAEVVKQRMQMYNSPFTSIWDCSRTIMRYEGLRAFYRSYGTQLVMNVPFQVTHFVTYEYFQNITNPERVYNPKAHVISGGIAGAIAAAITTPLDVCKTLLNTQEAEALASVQQVRISGLFAAARTVYTLNGFRGYFQGLQARVIYQVPSTAICWTVYEFFKYFLSRNPSEPKYDSKPRSDKMDDVPPASLAKLPVKMAPKMDIL